MRYGLIILASAFGATVSRAAPPGVGGDHGQNDRANDAAAAAAEMHRETKHDPWMPTPPEPPQGVNTGRGIWTRGAFTSIQVNVDPFGNNIPGDAANEPSIAIDLDRPERIVIGWRQFDTVGSDFRQAGVAYSRDGGMTWTFPGVLEPGQFRSDPVLDMDAEGNFYFYSLSTLTSCELFKSTDGGVSWGPAIPAFGGDKEWMAIDRTYGVGHGNIYGVWSPFSGCCGDRIFTRSTDGGQTFMEPIRIPGSPYWGTIAVGPNGEVYVCGDGFVVAKSSSLQNETQPAQFEFATSVSLDGYMQGWGGPNPAGLLGQAWIAVDRSNGPNRGNVYVLCSVQRSSTPDPLDVMFARSTDGGFTWSLPVRVNDDESEADWQWFGTMSVAPNGRIDVIWNDTRNTDLVNLCELYYAFSTDGGSTWSKNIPVSPVFDSYLGWPEQSKLGDYYDMISFDLGVSVAYAATFNGEQDVYYLWLSVDCNDNGIFDVDEVAAGSAEDCNGNYVPDECEPDFDGDGVIDGCDEDIDDDRVLNEWDVCDYTMADTPIDAQGRPISDTNGNCEIDLIDCERFTMCLSESGPGTSGSPSCIEAFDYDRDGDTDLADFAGIQLFFTRR